MATLNYYLSRYVTKDNQRGEIQMRFSGNRQFVKRAPTGIFITAANWDAEKGMPKNKKMIKYGDDCEEIRERLNMLSTYLMRCWEQHRDGELENDSLTKWVNDIEWESKKEEILLGGQKVEVTRWNISSKSQKEAEKEQKRIQNEMFEKNSFLDAFSIYIDEQHEKGVIVSERKKTYKTCKGLWDRMERFQGKHYNLKEVTTSTLYEFRHFIINECDLWTINKEGKYVPKSRFEYIYEDYGIVKSRGVERRSLNYVVIQFKMLKAFWHWLNRVKKLKLEDIFEDFTMDQSVYGTPYFLSNDDRKKLFEADFSKRPELGIQRDIFVFQSLVGCRVGDLTRLKKSNIIDGEVLQYVAGKTKNHSGRVVTVPLHPTAKEILDRYKDRGDDRLLPFISDQNYNEAIKEMFKAVEEINHTVTILDPVTRLEKQVKLSEVASSHMGRRNFCGNLYEAGFRDSDITSMSGHSEGSRAIARYRKVSDETKKKMIGTL